MLCALYTNRTRCMWTGTWLEPNKSDWQPLFIIHYIQTTQAQREFIALSILCVHWISIVLGSCHKYVTQMSPTSHRLKQEKLCYIVVIFFEKGDCGQNTIPLEVVFCSENKTRKKRKTNIAQHCAVHFVCIRNNFNCKWIDCTTSMNVYTYTTHKYQCESRYTICADGSWIETSPTSK